MIKFNNRYEAGRMLFNKIAGLDLTLKKPLILGIPRGGVAIGAALAQGLQAPLDTITLRKLPFPDNPEAGFGAVTLDKVVILNEKLINYYRLDEHTINRIVDEVYKEVLRRNRIYRQNKPFPKLNGRTVIITDDGLASGFTMLAAIRFARQRDAGEIIVAVPVAHRQAYDMIKKESDNLAALHVSDQPYFAVAGFYDDFPDMTDNEVISYLTGEKQGSFAK
ncbi:MAG: phosphoribosyltransferase [Planctomycetes bacterium]|nr:phosphoribosyltransferase [Planctomycetota bacterium]